LATIPGTQTQTVSKQADNLRAALGVRSISGWCHVDGCRIAWEEIPAKLPGPPILFLHSAGSGSREFRPLLHRLKAGIQLIFLDWPGHGRSTDWDSNSISDPPSESNSKSSGHPPQPTFDLASAVRIIQAVLNQTGSRQAIVVGAGFGAAAAIQFATDCPDQVLGLVLSQPAGLIPAQFPSSSAKGHSPLRTQILRIRKLSPDNSANLQRTAAIRQAMRLELLRIPMLPWSKAAELSMRQSQAALRSAIQTIHCPAIFALSRDDRRYPLRKYLALLDPSLAWAPQHQFTIFSGAFSPIWDEPDRFSIALASFVQSILPFQLHSHAWIIAAVDYPAKNSNLWKCVHPDCSEERILLAGQDANRLP